MRPRLKQLQQMVFGRTSPGNRWLFYPQSVRKMTRKVGDGSSSSVVTAPLLWIGRNFPEAPPALWQRMPDSGEEERVSGEGEQGGDHLMLELLERPTPYYSGALLWMATVMDWHLSGDAYWLKIRDRGGRPRELWWTPSTMLEPKGNETEFITHYEYRVDAKVVEIPSEDIVHFRYGMDPVNPRKGKSPLSALLHEVFTDDEAADFTATLLGNMGVPGVVVSPKGEADIPDDDVKATKAYFKGAFTGSRRGEPLVMSGPTSVSQFGFNPQQMQLREIRRIPEERVTACLGVPAIVAGLGAGLDRSTFANYAEAREAAYQDNIIPAQRIIAEEVKHQLLVDFEPDNFQAFRFGFDLSNVRVLQEDRNALANRFDVGIRGGWIRVAEGRRAMELEVDDTDEVYLRGVAVIEIPVGQSAPAPTLLSPGQGPAQPPQLPPGQQPQLPPGQARRNGHAPKRVAEQRLKARVTRVETTLAKAFARDHLILSNQFSKELQSDFIHLGQLCADVYLRAEMVSTSTASDGVLTRTKVEPEILVRMILASTIRDFKEELGKRFGVHTLRTMEKTIDTINMVTNLGVGVSDVRQREIFDAGGKRLGLIDIEGQTKQSLFNTINEGNQLGHNPRVIARSIRDEVPAGPFASAGPSYRSELISRTETNWAQNVSSLTAYREADTVTACIAMDGADDPECAERDGVEFSIDDAEVEMANEHPNGTLSFAPVVSDEAPTPPPPEDVSYLQEPIDLDTLAQATGKVDSVADFESAVNKISDVHDFPGTSRPVRVRIGNTRAGGVGEYNWRTRRISIRSGMHPDMTRATAYHETGHYFDNMLGRAIGGDLRMSASHTAEWARPPSATVEKLMKELDKQVYTKYDADYATYLADRREQFARAYAQYIAEKTSDSKVLDILARSDGQWSKAAFKPVSKLFDELLDEQKLAKPMTPLDWQLQHMNEVGGKADEYINQIFKDQRLSPSEEKNLELYAGSKESFIINSGLRGDGLNVGSEATVRRIDSAIEKTITGEDMVVFRGMSSKSPIGKLKIGAEFTDHGYASTSVLSHVAQLAIARMERGGRVIRGSVTLKIRVPRGTHAVSTGKAGLDKTQEKEVILGRNSKFRVVSKEQTPHGIHLEVEYIGEGVQGVVPKMRGRKTLSDDALIASRFVWDEGDVEVEHA